MAALILLTHGSRHPEIKPVPEDVVALVCEKIPLTRLDVPPQIRLAWLDLDESPLDTVCTELVAVGEAQALVVPLLFVDAFHSWVDVLEQVRLRDRHGIDITVAEGFGLGDGTKRAIVKWIIEVAEDASPSWPVDVLVMEVGFSDEGASAAVHQFAANLDRMLPGHASAAFVAGPEKIKGVDTVVAAQERAAKRGRGLVAAPLFTTPGLLWGRIIDAGAAVGVGQVAFGEPLAELLAPVVCYRRDLCAAYVDV